LLTEPAEGEVKGWRRKKEGEKKAERRAAIVAYCRQRGGKEGMCARGGAGVERRARRERGKKRRGEEKRLIRRAMMGERGDDSPFADPK